MDLHKMLVDSLTAQDRGRARSVQTAIGPSAVGSCRRKVWHMLSRTPKTNETDTLAAIMGTLIHAGIAEAIKREDPFGDNFLIEQRLEHPLITGNVDLFIKDKGIVVDWKTTKVKSLRYFPSPAQLYQVQIYGWLLTQHGYTVNKVALVAIPRDGESPDIRVHMVDYDEDTALAGLRWLEEIREMVQGGIKPQPEERLSFCAKYCSYYDPTGEIGCPSTAR